MAACRKSFVAAAVASVVLTGAAPALAEMTVPPPAAQSSVRVVATEVIPPPPPPRPPQGLAAGAVTEHPVPGHLVAAAARGRASGSGATLTQAIVVQVVRAGEAPEGAAGG